MVRTDRKEGITLKFRASHLCQNHLQLVLYHSEVGKNREMVSSMFEFQNTVSNHLTIHHSLGVVGIMGVCVCKVRRDAMDVARRATVLEIVLIPDRGSMKFSPGLRLLVLQLL